jgi:hypothetical protein
VRTGRRHCAGSTRRCLRRRGLDRRQLPLRRPPRRLPRPAWSSRSSRSGLPGKCGSNGRHRLPRSVSGGASTHSAATTLTTSPPQMTTAHPTRPPPHAPGLALRGRRHPARWGGGGARAPRRCGSRRRTSLPRPPRSPRSADHPPLPQPRSPPRARSSVPWAAARMFTRVTRARLLTQAATARVHPVSRPGTLFATTPWPLYCASSLPCHPRNAAPRPRCSRGTTSSLWR